jgi:hypothetical protein
LTIYAVDYIKEIGTGEMQPQLFKCSDGNRYVVKLMSNPLGKKALFNELISYRLGRLLNLPIAKGCIINFSKKRLKNSSFMEKFRVQEGPHFGSLFLEGTSHFTEKNLSKCSNLDIVPEMIVFDHWISNSDRSSESQNLLIVNGEKPSLLMIDHADAFFGPNWDIRSLIKQTENSEVIWGKNYQAFIPFIDNKNPFEKALFHIDAILNEQIAIAILRDIPKEWQVSKNELKVLLYHLITRKEHMRKILFKLKPFFPIWSSDD